MIQCFCSKLEIYALTYVEELELYEEEFDIDLNGYGEIVPEEERACTCCFTGHRVMSKSQRSEVLYRLRSTILYFVSKGVVNFRAGGALGFDTLAATMVVDLKRSDNRIKLILDLPYEGQDENWSDTDKRIYKFICENADVINVFDKRPSSRRKATELLYKRNRALVDNSDYCVCYLKKKGRSGTAYTVDYAKRLDREIINLYSEEE